ncbi:YHS domain-containing protein [Mycolicibacterium frederiksbergense]
MPGTPVNRTAAEAAGLFRDYRGRRYWFCCNGCGPRFDRDPDKFASAA